MKKTPPKVCASIAAIFGLLLCCANISAQDTLNMHNKNLPADTQHISPAQQQQNINELQENRNGQSVINNGQQSLDNGQPPIKGITIPPASKPKPVQPYGNANDSVMKAQSPPPQKKN